MKKTKKVKNGKKISREFILIFLLFILVLGIRLFFAFQEPGFDYDAYNSLRQAEHIKETGLPLFKDPLSYSGRTQIFPPFFYYVLAVFSFIIPLTIVAKLIPSIAFSFIVIVIYIIAKHITKNKTAAFIAALFSGFVPIVFTNLNLVSSNSLSLVLILFLSYVFMRIEEKGFASLSIVLTILLLLTHTSVFILLMSFIVYFLLIKLEKLKLNIKEVEITLFLFFLALWFNILLYKKAFFLHGISFIWKNIPTPLLSSYFKDISFIGVIYAVGVIPLLLGVYAVYHALFKTKNRAATLYICFALVSFIILWLKLIPFRTGLLFLSMNLIILSAYSLKVILVNAAKTKSRVLPNLLTGLAVLLFVLTTITPLVSTVRTEMPLQEDINALEWMKNNTNEDAVVLGRVEEGFLINYISKRENVADSNFLFINNIDQRYNDINHLFTLRLKSEAVRLINKYDIDYLWLSTMSMKEYNISKIFYAEEDCFDVVYDNNTIIYELLECDI